MLARHLEGVPADPDAFAFTAPRGGTLRVNNWRKRTWKPALEEVNLPTDVRIHDLRHTCASLPGSPRALTRRPSRRPSGTRS